VRVYAPVVYGYARHHGLQDADAADLSQEVLRAVAGGVGRLKTDRPAGSFRAWLYSVAHHKLCDLLGRRRHGVQGTGDTAICQVLNDQPAPEEDAALWRREFEQRAFAWAAEQVRPQVQPVTWQAFWLSAVEGRSGKEVAEALGMSVAAVYLAKSRVVARLKEQIQLIQADETFFVDEDGNARSGLPLNNSLEVSARPAPSRR
jgi:RNA polymerase sigma-70 factor (ECF subfamily)